MKNEVLEFLKAEILERKNTIIFAKNQDRFDDWDERVCENIRKEMGLLIGAMELILEPKLSDIKLK